MKTLDLVLWRGKGLFSLAILWVCSLFRHTITKYSHISLVVCDGDRVMLFEAVQSGVQLVAMSDALQKYNGTAVVRHLVGERTGIMLTSLKIFIQNQLGKKYEKDLTELLSAAQGKQIGKDDETDWFCSELVTKCLQLCGLIPEIPMADTYAPDDYSLGCKVDAEIELFSDPHDLDRVYCLSEEIPLEKTVGGIDHNEAMKDIS